LQKYRFKFYLNAVHAIEINGVLGQEHPHTWEFGIEAFKSDDSFVMFTEVERGMERLFSAYQNRKMNDVPPFDGLNPTLENVSIYFKKRIERFLLDLKWFLSRVEISETPSRSFIIENSKDEEEREIDMDELWFREIENAVEQYLSGQLEATQKQGENASHQTDVFEHRKRRGLNIAKKILMILYALGILGLLLLLQRN
jgi:6-pyruvoyltetrahydropterin/6-carboxytetrahydropterin synthase